MRKSRRNKYKRAFRIACELLNGGYLYGYDTDKIFELIMEAEGVVSPLEYETFILKHLNRLEGRGKDSCYRGTFHVDDMGRYDPYTDSFVRGDKAE